MPASLFIALLVVVVGVLAATFARAWGHHRRRPESLQRRAKGAWSKTGLRWSPTGYVTVHAFVALLATVLGVALFARLADSVIDQAAITRFDVAFDNRLHAAATPVGVRIAEAVSFVGGPVGMAVLMIAGVIYLLVRRRHIVLYAWLIAFLGGGALNLELKTIFHRARPSFPNPFVQPAGYSFPSGHSMGALIGFGMLAYVIIHSLRRRAPDVAIAVCAAMFTLCVGFSRLYLGAHYPSDVLAGFSAGLVWLAGCISAVEATDPAPPR